MPRVVDCHASAPTAPSSEPRPPAVAAPAHRFPPAAAFCWEPPRFSGFERRRATSASCVRVVRVGNVPGAARDRSVSSRVRLPGFSGRRGRRMQPNRPRMVEAGAQVMVSIAAPRGLRSLVQAPLDAASVARGPGPEGKADVEGASSMPSGGPAPGRLLRRRRRSTRSGTCSCCC